MKRKLKALFVLLFFCACVVPSLGMLVVGESQASANEVLSPKPQLKNPDGSWNLEFIPDAGDYFADRFAFRQELITADSAWKAGLLHTSSQEQVALGQDGWLFYAETLEDYTGADALTDRQVWAIARSLQLAQEYVESKGGSFLFTVAPNKLSLYPQYGPGGLERGEVTALSQVTEALGENGVPYSDLYSAFTQQEEVLYHQWDSHWTYKGAALAHDVLLSDLGLSGDMFQREGSYVKDHQGDLYVMLYPASDELEDQWHFANDLAFEYATPIRDVDDLRIETTSAGTNGNLLMFRDSFGNTLHSLLAESFGHAVFSRATPYDLGVMDTIQADTVILEIVERNLKNLAEYPFVLPAPQTDLTLASWGASREEAAIAVQAVESPQFPGYLTVTGNLPGCDDDSPIYLVVGDTAYEASPVGSGGSQPGNYPFTAYLPAGTDLTGAVALYRTGGESVFCALGQAG